MNITPDAAKGISVIIFFILINVLVYLKSTNAEREIKNNRRGLIDERKHKNN